MGTTVHRSPASSVSRPRPAKPPPSRSGGKSRTASRRPSMVVKASVGRNLVMEEVTILKRGEEIRSPIEPSTEPPTDSIKPDVDELVFSATGRLGPEPEILPKAIGFTVYDPVQNPYAGSAFISSPAPSCVPFPTAFFVNRELVDKADMATRSLRFLLRLDVA